MKLIFKLFPDPVGFFNRILVLKVGYIRKMSQLREIGTFVFLDLETTGLPYMEHNKTKITELCLIAVQTSHIRLGVFPRVQNKLSICFNPCKLISADAEKVTGLSNHLLENLSKFTEETVSSIHSFLNHNPKPICFVAHNGNHFDYPILQREINRTKTLLPDDILCIDSLVAFKELHLEDAKKVFAKDEIDDEENSFPLEQDETLSSTEPGKFYTKYTDKVVLAQKINETTPKKQMIANSEILESFSGSEIPPYKKIKLAHCSNAKKNLKFDVSFKLQDIYTRLTKKTPENVHQAEGDVFMLIMCAATLGDRFVDWAKLNAKKFCDIPAMVPGRKIGT